MTTRANSATRDTIKPIITSTYGGGTMADALAAHLARKIDAREWDSRGREHMVMLACWDWFAGGGTAESVAGKIEAALGGAA